VPLNLIAQSWCAARIQVPPAYLESPAHGKTFRVYGRGVAQPSANSKPRPAGHLLARADNAGTGRRHRDRAFRPAVRGLRSEPPGPGRPREFVGDRTSPDVNSIYQRLVAVRPETEGHIANPAEGGASASALVALAQQALEAVSTLRSALSRRSTTTSVVTGRMARTVNESLVALAEALEVVTAASPDPRIFVVGQLGQPSLSPSPPRCSCDDPRSAGAVLSTSNTDGTRWAASTPASSV